MHEARSEGGMEGLRFPWYEWGAAAVDFDTTGASCSARWWGPNWQAFRPTRRPAGTAPACDKGSSAAAPSRSRWRTTCWAPCQWRRRSCSHRACSQTSGRHRPPPGTGAGRSRSPCRGIVTGCGRGVAARARGSVRRAPVLRQRHGVSQLRRPTLPACFQWLMCTA